MEYSNDTIAIIENQVRYIVENHGCKYFNNYFETKFDTSTVQNSNYQITDVIMDSLGIGYPYAYDYDDNQFSFTIDNSNLQAKVQNISNYNYLYSFSQYLYGDNDAFQEEFQIEDDLFVLMLTNYNLTIEFNDSTSLLFDIGNFVDSLRIKYDTCKNYTIPKNDFFLKAESPKFNFKIQFLYLEGKFIEDTAIVSHIYADIFIKNKTTRVK